MNISDTIVLYWALWVSGVWYESHYIFSCYLLVIDHIREYTFSTQTVEPAARGIEVMVCPLFLLHNRVSASPRCRWCCAAFALMWSSLSVKLPAKPCHRKTRVNPFLCHTQPSARKHLIWGFWLSSVWRQKVQVSLQLLILFCLEWLHLEKPVKP